MQEGVSKAVAVPTSVCLPVQLHGQVTVRNYRSLSSLTLMTSAERKKEKERT
jgi:hypothetical protein